MNRRGFLRACFGGVAAALGLAVVPDEVEARRLEDLDFVQLLKERQDAMLREADLWSYGAIITEQDGAGKLTGWHFMEQVPYHVWDHASFESKMCELLA